MRLLRGQFCGDYEDHQGVKNNEKIDEFNIGNWIKNKIKKGEGVGNIEIILHKPHPRKELEEYQIKQALKILRKKGLI